MPSESIWLKEIQKFHFRKVLWVFAVLEGEKIYMITEFVTEQFPKQTMLFSPYVSFDFFF